MSDVFISYASEDRQRVQVLVEALQQRSWSIFWDRTIPAGQPWRRVIGDELQAARCIIVVWSDASIHSTWVADEADVGLQRNILVPIAFDRVPPPLGFRAIQTRDLSGLSRNRDGPDVLGLIDDIERVLSSPGSSDHRRTLSSARRLRLTRPCGLPSRRSPR
jgi:hypothetical protein